MQQQVKAKEKEKAKVRIIGHQDCVPHLQSMANVPEETFARTYTKESSSSSVPKVKEPTKAKAREKAAAKVRTEVDLSLQEDIAVEDDLRVERMKNRPAEHI